MALGGSHTPPTSPRPAERASRWGQARGRCERGLLALPSRGRCPLSRAQGRGQPPHVRPGQSSACLQKCRVETTTCCPHSLPARCTPARPLLTAPPPGPCSLHPLLGPCSLHPLLSPFSLPPCLAWSSGASGAHTPYDQEARLPSRPAGEQWKEVSHEKGTAV